MLENYVNKKRLIFFDFFRALLYFIIAGMIVAGFARRVEKIKEIADNLEDTPGKLYPVECDITNEKNVISAFAWVKDHLGPLSVLVNSAGIIKESSLIGAKFYQNLTFDKIMYLQKKKLLFLFFNVKAILFD